MKEMMNDIKSAWARQESTLYFFYYAGHAVMYNNQVYAVLGTERDKSKALYPLEANLRFISMLSGGCIVAVLACGRERFSSGVVGKPLDVT